MLSRRTTSGPDSQTQGGVGATYVSQGGAGDEHRDWQGLAAVFKA